MKTENINASYNSLIYVRDISWSSERQKCNKNDKHISHVKFLAAVCCVTVALNYNFSASRKIYTYKIFNYCW